MTTIDARPCDDARHGRCRGHCAVCNGRMDRKRYSRVTCSDRCRQYLHRHRDEVHRAVANSRGIEE